VTTPVARPYAITAYAAACALGATTAEVVTGLRAGRSGLVRLGRDDGLPFETWFGALPSEPVEPAPPLGPWDARQARVALHVVAEVEDAVRRAVARWGSHRVGLVLGTTTGGVSETEDVFAAYVRDGRFPPGFDFVRRHAQHAAGEVVAARLGLAGPRVASVSACSSSTKAFGTARRWLDAGVVDAVLVAGVDTRCRMTLLGFHALEVLSSERCTPFGAGRRGINLGEGAGFVLVERDGDARGWLRAVGETSDAFHLTQPRPDGAGVHDAMAAALAASGLRPEQVDLVNPHATGTPYNDAAEARALAALLPHRPPVVATKGYTGHTLGACGAIEAVMCLVSLEQGWAPAALTGPLDPDCDVAVPTAPIEGRFRVALNVSAAFAGHNAAVVLEGA
jgi:3-oxoacyl-[acyl-carrier-protein] synthase-1